MRSHEAFEATKLFRSPAPTIHRCVPGREAGDATREASLIVSSHGTGGSGLSMECLGEALAAHGYIAAAVNHPGNNAAAHK